jgi:hypothetical protein
MAKKYAKRSANVVGQTKIVQKAAYFLKACASSDTIDQALRSAHAQVFAHMPLSETATATDTIAATSAPQPGCHKGHDLLAALSRHCLGGSSWNGRPRCHQAQRKNACRFRHVEPLSKAILQDPIVCQH